MKFIPDPGGPMLLRETSLEAGYLKGLVMDILICSEPDCPCRDVYLTVAEVDERRPPFPQVQNRRSLSTEMIEKLLKDKSAVQITYNLDTEAISARKGQTVGPAEADLILRLNAQIQQKGLSEVIRNRWNITKNFDPEAYKQKDWSWWEPGILVGYAEVFPNELNLLFSDAGRTILIDDQYCVTPGCHCQAAAVTFVEILEKEPAKLGTLFIELPQWRIESAEPGPLSKDELAGLLKVFQNQYIDAKRLLAERRQKTRKAMAEVLKPKTTAPPSRPSGKISRNDPCPCDSGRKYKKCCLGK